MTNKPFLPGYSGETIDQLLELEGRYRRDSVVLAVEQAITQKRARLGDSHISDAEWVVLSVEALEREANNGGYHQFFFNPSNEFVGRIENDLRRIGWTEVADLTSQAIAALELPELVPSAIQDRVVVEDDRLEEALNDLDAAYYTLAEDVALRLLIFIRENRESFTIP